MNVLSIDIDYITKKYADDALGDDFNIKFKWDELLKHSENVLLEIDFDNLSFLMNVFFKALNNSDKIIFATYHHTILKELEKCENLNIINIDHHHDIFYSSSYGGVDFFNKYDTVDTGNWVWKLHSLGKIESYHWIKNENSSRYDDGLSNGILPKNYKTYLKDTLDYDILNKKYDLFFICLSPDYTAPQHWFYYDMMLKIYEEKTGNIAQFVQNVPEIRIDHLKSCSNIFDYRLK